ncbi:MAG: T9SS type A sorting domain-containing protein [Bacteroidota bacterium]
MKKIIKNIGTIALSISSFAFFATTAQSQSTGNNLWSFPPNYLDQDNFSIDPLPEVSNPVPFDDYNGDPATNTHNVMRDMDGNVRFFVVDNRVFDSQGRLIDKMYRYSTDIKGAAETLILPDPSDCQRYYIFSVGREDYATNSKKEPFYAIVDLAAQNIYDNTRDGALVTPNTIGQATAKSIANLTPNFYGASQAGEEPGKKHGNIFIAATKKNCDNERFVFVSTQNGIHKYILDQNGLTYANEFIPFQLASPFNQLTVRSGMEVVQLPGGNYRIATGHKAQQSNLLGGHGLFTAELDSQGSLIPGSEQSFFLADEPDPNNTAAYIHGLEFSPDGSILYVTHNSNNANPNPIEYFNFDNNVSDLEPLQVTDADDFEMSQMEIDKDGDLVLVTEDRIAALKNPNTPNANNWNNSEIVFQNTPYQPNDESTGFPANSDQNRAITSYIFPDQVGGMNYTKHLTANLACMGETSSSSTWSPGNNPFGSANGEVYLDGDLIIPAGTNVQMNDMKFYFTPGSKLIVERGDANNSGARLTMLRSTLTVDDRCYKDAMWNGVQVQGYANKNQFPSGSTKQGWLRTYGNSKIEHAYIGVATSVYESQSTFPFEPGNASSSSSGGIVQASNTTFLNNRQDIVWMSYQPPNGQDNRGSAKNCEFITDGELKDPNTYPFTHVNVFGCVGIDLTGNDYINETPNLYPYNRIGSGIFSFNSQIKVKARCQSLIPIGGQCPNFDRSKFKNLYYGIISLSSVSGRKTTIDRSLFINNYFGALLTNNDFAEVTRNDFEVYRSAAPNETLQTVGLYLSGSDGYQVEANTFTEFDDPNVGTNGNTYGIIVNNSGTGDNEVYRNEFEDIKIGGQSQRINSENYDPSTPSPNNVGLRWKCNDFNGDIFEADLAITSGRIAYQQGYCYSPAVDPVIAVQSPAGNRFSQSTFTSENDIAANPGVLPFDYAHHADAFTTPTNYDINVVSPDLCFNNLNQVNYDVNNSCPSKIVDLKPGVGVTPVLPSLKSQLDSIKEVITSKEALIDDDQTGFLVNYVNSGNDGAVKNTLLEISPYLSDEVLLAYISSNPPNGHLKQVILANAPVTDNVMEILENSNISNGVMNQINNAQVGKSERDRLISEIGYAETERSLLLNKTIRLVLEDTIMPGRLDTVAVLLEEESKKRRKEQLCDVYLCDRDTSQFDDTRDDIEAAFGVNNFVRIADMNHLLSKETGAITTDTLKADNNLKQEVENIASDQNNRICAVRAEAILSMFRDSVRIPVVEDLYLNGGNKMAATHEQSDKEKLSEMKLYPNPSNGNSVTVEIDNEAYEKPTIEVVDLTGKRVDQFAFNGQNKVKIKTAEYKGGVYFVKLNDHDRFIETRKLIVQ